MGSKGSAPAPPPTAPQSSGMDPMMMQMFSQMMMMQMQQQPQQSSSPAMPEPIPTPEVIATEPVNWQDAYAKMKEEATADYNNEPRTTAALADSFVSDSGLLTFDEEDDA